MYRLKRDDGAELQVSGGTWEAALELGYVYGWRPAGTETPQSGSWRARRAATRTPVWDSQDYFSHESQHVGRDDARALAEAISDALLDIPDDGEPRTNEERAVETVAASPIPTRASALAEGLSVQRRKGMRRFAAFADRGGFTIAGAP